MITMLTMTKMCHPEILIDNHVSVCSAKMGAANRWALAVLMIVAAVAGSSIIDSSIRIRHFGQSLTINCSQEDSTMYSDVVLKYWVLPADMTIVYPEVSNNSNVQLLDKGWSLHIDSVEPKDLGTYLCLTVSTNRRPYNQYSRVNVYKTSPETWKQFRQNTITGAIAAGATFILIVFVCIIYGCRWRPAPGQRKDNRMKRSLYDIEYSYEPQSPTVTSDM
ncbi:hypothetical protein NP493_325g01004 [Ridgeia piscesae]|uniref:Ig-like domain-containing protein n=1 Tax=Ridgeia piscesae TaxID=27915 RepID=A0AAD9NUA6_RIDPI|nr:hypothetical protein NP493_325g01004 [Ridgeia piscesae]